MRISSTGKESIAGEMELRLNWEKLLRPLEYEERRSKFARRSVLQQQKVQARGYDAMPPIDANSRHQ